MLLSGSIFILGFFTITRGEIVTLPNGDTEKEQEIFGAWQLFWEDIIMYKKVFYEGDQLEFKLKLLEQMKPAYMGEISFSTERRSFIFNTSPTDAELRDISFVLEVKILNKGEICFLYDEYPVYRFSEWVRKITNCYVCLSSIGGTLYYWLLMYFYPNVFFNSINPTLSKTIFWIIYCVSLSFTNKVIKEYFDSDKK